MLLYRKYGRKYNQIHVHLIRLGDSTTNLDVRCDTTLLIPLIVRIQVFPMVSTSDYTIVRVFVVNYIFLDRYNRIVEYECHASLIQIENAVEEKIINDHFVAWVRTEIFVPQQLVDLLHSLSSSELQ